MTTQKYCQDLRQLIGEGQLEEALKALSALLQSSPKLDEVVLQSARWQEVKRLIRLGQLPRERAAVTQNQIRAGVLELIREVEEKTADPEIRKEVDRHVQSISGKNIVSGSTIQAGGNVSIGDQIQHFTESKTSRNIRVWLFILVPVLAIAAAVLYYRYQQMQQPLLLTVALDNQTPNAELDKDFRGGQVVLRYGGKADTQAIVNEAVFKGIPANYSGEPVQLKFDAAGFRPVDTTFALKRETITLPIRRDDTYARIAGVVTDEDGKPVPEATVSTQRVTQQTDRQGQFTLQLPFAQQRRQQRLRVTKPGYRPWDRTEPVFPDETIRIQLIKQ